jgi:formylglycine-generating enzyme required for sulfatase activity/uncharacterized caspase-like protein
MRVLAAILLVLLLLPAWVQAAPRVALVIGNGAYATAPALPNPSADATAMAAALEDLGFTVIRGIDLDGVGMRRAIRDFAHALDRTEIALFYYAGHGIQRGGANYLIPVDAELTRDSDIDLAAIDLDLVLRQIDDRAATRIVLLDACRNNPFATQLAQGAAASRSLSLVAPGLAPVQTAGGALIGFATDPGAVALDGDGRHSPFTEALLDHIATPGLEINVLMTRVRADVFARTGQQQRPWTTTSLIGEVYLAGGTQAGRTDTAAEIELAYWRSVEAGGGAADYAAYLAHFPDGIFAEIARLRLAALPAAPVDQAAAPPPPEAAEEPAAPDPGRTTGLVIAPDHVQPAAVPPAAPAGDERPCDACPALRPLPAGSFRMGSDDRPAEAPSRTVTVAPVAMAVGEVTVGAFRRFVEATGHRVEAGCSVWTADGRLRSRREASWQAPGYPVTDDHPVACVAAADAQAYVAWLNGQVPGGGFRLPSEAEFEYALRAGATGDYPWGDDPAAVCGVANGADATTRFRWRWKRCTDPATDTAPMGVFPANAWGLHDLSGNLWEWTADCWRDSHRGAPGDARPRDDARCESRVVKGGSFDDPVENLRITYRAGIPSRSRQANVGFRVVRDVPR